MFARAGHQLLGPNGEIPLATPHEALHNPGQLGAFSGAPQAGGTQRPISAAEFKARGLPLPGIDPARVTRSGAGGRPQPARVAAPAAAGPRAGGPPALPQEHLEAAVPYGTDYRAAAGYGAIAGYGAASGENMAWPGAWGYPSTPKKGLFGKVKWEDQYATYGHQYYQKPTPAPKVNSVPSYGRPLPRVDGDVNPNTALFRTPPPTMVAELQGKPLPDNFWQLSKKMQKAIIKERQKEAALWKTAEKQQVKLYKESMKLKEKEIKDKRKAEEKERKQKEKAFINALKDPGLGARPLPAVKPGKYATPAEAQAAATAAATIGADGKPRRVGRALQQLPQDPLTHIMLPTGEEFGVRRPFDVNGLPAQLGGSSSWPMMSRTMTHALLDLSKEESAQMLSNQTLYKPDW